MKSTHRLTLICGIAVIVTMTAFAQRRRVPPVAIEGVYENLTVGKESGDLEGMRVILIDGGGGIHAIVQEAGGGVELPDPVLTKVDVKGTDVSFSVKFPGSDEEQMFSGKVTALGLNLRRGSSSSGEKPVLLRRKKY